MRSYCSLMRPYLLSLLLAAAMLLASANVGAGSNPDGDVVATFSLLDPTADADASATTEKKEEAAAQGAVAEGCRRTAWEGFTTSGLLCQGGVNGRCRYRVPIGRALTLGANTLLVSFANAALSPAAAAATGAATNSTASSAEEETLVVEEAEQARRHHHTAILTAEHPTHHHRSDAHLSSLAKAARPLARLVGSVRRALSSAASGNEASAAADEAYKTGEPVLVKRFDLNAIARKRQQEATALAVAGSVVPWGSTLFAFDEETEGGRREFSMRLLLDEGVIEVEDFTEGWRTPGLARPDLCRCAHCACIRALTVRAWRCPV